MINFIFKNSLKNHPNIISVDEISVGALPPGAKNQGLNLSKVFISQTMVRELEYELLICEPKGFPNCLPYIYLANPEQHDFHNHVNYSGEICYTERGENVFIDVNEPEQILFQSLDMAIEVLSGSIDRDLKELQEEFEGYWHSLPDCVYVNSFVSPSKTPLNITALLNPKRKQIKIPYVFYNESLPTEYGYTSKVVNFQSVKAWYIPLFSPTFPPHPDSELTPAFVRGLLNHSGSPDLKNLKKLLATQKNRKKGKLCQRYEHFLFSQPRPSGKLALFGVTVSGYATNTFFEDENNEDWRVIPLAINHHNESYLIERGGGDQSLREFTVAVIGCGSVGSRIIEQLSLCGVGRLIVIDHDIFSKDNVYRHVLGGDSIGSYKSEEMEKHLRQRLPYVDILSKTINREKWISETDLSKISIIVDATADFTGLRDMNQMMLSSSNPVPVVYCWLEACSIGGHALLIDGINSGCLECLIKKTNKGLCRKSDFLEPFQNVTKDLTGCGGSFTPFSTIDSIKTATMAAELVIEKLLHEKSNSYRYWIGVKTIAERAGIKTSKWYKRASTGEIDNIENKFYLDNCPICNRKQ